MQETPPLSISLGFIFYNSEQLLYVMCQELQNVPSSSVINRNKSKSSLLGRAVCYFAYQYFKESNVYCNPASLCSHCGGFRSTSTLDCLESWGATGPWRLSAAHFSQYAALKAFYPVWPQREQPTNNVQCWGLSAHESCCNLAANGFCSISEGLIIWRTVWQFRTNSFPSCRDVKWEEMNFVVSLFNLSLQLVCDDGFLTKNKKNIFP